MHSSRDGADVNAAGDRLQLVALDRIRYIFRCEENGRSRRRVRLIIRRQFSHLAVTASQHFRWLETVMAFVTQPNLTDQFELHSLHPWGYEYRDLAGHLANALFMAVLLRPHERRQHFFEPSAEFFEVLP
jgi:hypothetical protein